MTRQELKLQLIGSFIAGNRWDISTPGGKVIIYREVDAILERVLGAEITRRTPEEMREYERQEQFTPTDGQAFESFETHPSMDAFGRVYLSPRQTGRTQELRDEVAARNIADRLANAANAPLTTEHIDALMRGSVQFEAEEESIPEERITRRQRRGRGLATPIVLENEDGTETFIDSDALRRAQELEEEDNVEEDTTTDDRQDEEGEFLEVVFPEPADFAGTMDTVPMTPEIAFGTPSGPIYTPPIDDASFIDAMMREAGALPTENVGPSEPQVTITPVALRF